MGALAFCCTSESHKDKDFRPPKRVDYMDKTNKRGADLIDIPHKPYIMIDSFLEDE